MTVLENISLQKQHQKMNNNKSTWQESIFKFNSYQTFVRDDINTI